MITKFEQYQKKREEPLSIVIPCGGSVGFLAQTVESLKRCTDNFELVFSVNSPDKQYRDWIRAECEKNKNFKMVEHDRQLGFSIACNNGIAVSSHDLLIILNDDVIVHNGWAEKLYTCLEKSRAVTKLRSTGMVGPVSNYVGGEQCVKGASGLHPFMVEKFSEQWTAEHLIGYHVTGFISGFCMMTRKKILEKTGLFDERFHPAGWEDNDLCLRIQQAGHELVISGDCFVYHYGSRTISDTWKIPQKTFIEKWSDEGVVKKLVVMFRVKINDDANYELFERALVDCARYADGVVIFDDDSPKCLAPLIQKHQEKFDLIYQKYRHETFDESRDRNELLRLAKELCVDIEKREVGRGKKCETWILSLDHDEIMEKDFDREQVDRLMNPPSPHIKTYGFWWATFWRGEELVRTDGIWGRMSGYRMFKNEPGQFVQPGSKGTGLHNGCVPVFPQYCCRFTSFQIKHYGYADYEAQAKVKREWYLSIDQERNPELVGNSDYSHLVNEVGMKMSPWMEHNSATLVFMARKMQLDELYNFISNNYSFFKEIIFINTGTDNDNAVWFAKKFGMKVYDFTPKTHPDMFYADGPFVGKFKDFSAARNFGLSKVNTKWVMFLDPDERIDEPMRIRPMMNADHEAYIFNVVNFLENGKMGISETCRFFRTDRGVKWSGLVHETTEESMHAKNIRMVDAPTKLVNEGMRSPDRKEKLAHYRDLCEESLRKNPNDFKAYYNIALYMIDGGVSNSDFFKGIDYLSKACQLNPKFFQARLNLAVNYTQLALQCMLDVDDILPNEHIQKGQIKRHLQMLSEIAGVGHGEE